MLRDGTRVPEVLSRRAGLTFLREKGPARPPASFPDPLALAGLQPCHLRQEALCGETGGVPPRGDQGGDREPPPGRGVLSVLGNPFPGRFSDLPFRRKPP